MKFRQELSFNMKLLTMTDHSDLKLFGYFNLHSLSSVLGLYPDFNYNSLWI